MFGLAQHYRIPTRLLDWTTNPLVAAYFAAKEVAERIHAGAPPRPATDGRLAVWALAHPFLVNVCTRWEPGATYVTVPEWSNPNLSAQRGAFTLVRFKIAKTPEEDIPDLDALFIDPRNVEQARRLGTNPEVPLFKFSLPHSEAPSLLHFLDRYGVNAASVFPGHASVAESMREDRLRRVSAPLIAGRPSQGN